MAIQVSVTVEVPGAPAVPGLTFRCFQGESDFPAMAALMNAVSEADQTEEAVTAEELANEYRHLPDFDPSQDLLFAEVDGEIVAFSRVVARREDQGAWLPMHRGYVHPRWRRRGLGRALLRWNERRARDLVAARSAEPGDALRFYQVWCEDKSMDKAALLQREGYAVARRNYLMRRDTLNDLPDALLPPGLELRPVRPEHKRAIWDAMVEAFRDHWSAITPTGTDYEMWLNHPLNDLRLWQIAWDGDQVAGVAINVVSREENERFGRREYWVEDLAVRRPWRKRGLGRALLVSSMRLLRDAHGMTSVALGVDAENVSGALRLYESVGFRPAQSASIYRKPMA